MRSLDATQAAMAATLAYGPAYCPADLFAGPPPRVLLGLKAHANTISHGRLKALEAIFPLLHEEMGADAFNIMCHSFIDTGPALAEPLAGIGNSLPSFMRQTGLPAAQIDIARLELAWLASACAADAPALAVVDLAGLDEVSLMALPVARHPAMRMLTLACPPAVAIISAAQGGDLDQLLHLKDARILLLTRPEAMVRMTAINEAARAALLILRHQDKRNSTADSSLGAMMAAAEQAAPKLDPSAALLTLMDAGAVIRDQDHGELKK